MAPRRIHPATEGRGAGWDTCQGAGRVRGQRAALRLRGPGWATRARGQDPAPTGDWLWSVLPRGAGRDPRARRSGKGTWGPAAGRTRRPAPPQRPRPSLRLRAGPDAPWLPSGRGGGGGRRAYLLRCGGPPSPRGAVTCGCGGGGDSRGGEGASFRKGWDLPSRPPGPLPPRAVRPRLILGSQGEQSPGRMPPATPRVPHSHPGLEPGVDGRTASFPRLCGRACLALLTNKRQEGI